MGNKWIGITVAGLVLATAAYGGYSLSKNGVSVTSVSSIPVSVSPVTTGSLTQGQMFSGVTDTAQKVPLAPAIPAKITRIHVKVGDKVTKGQPLFTVDSAAYQDTINKARAGVEAAKNAYIQVLAQQDKLNQQAQQQAQQAQNTQVEAQAKARADALARNQASEDAVQQAAAALAQAQKNYDDARNNYQVLKSMVDKGNGNGNGKGNGNGSVSKESLDQAYQEMTNAEAALKKAQDEYNRLKAEQATIVIPPAPGTPSGTVSVPAIHLPAVDAAQKQLIQAQNAYTVVMANLSSPVITAPISGTVEAINGEVGKQASNQEPFMVLGNVEGLRVVMNVPETLVNQFQNNQSLNIFFPTPGTRLTGTVQTISPVDPKSKSCVVAITIPKADGIKAGIVAQINVLPPDAQRGLLVPASALLTENQKSYVYIANGNKAVKKYITVTERDSDSAMITGVNEGDKVIVKGLSLINESVKISIN